MILRLDVPIDNAWHETLVGDIMHVDFNHKDVVSLWYDDRTEKLQRFMRVFNTDQAPPDDAAYIGSALDHRGQGEIHHLFWTDKARAEGQPIPPGERPHGRPGRG